MVGAWGAPGIIPRATGLSKSVPAERRARPPDELERLNPGHTTVENMTGLVYLVRSVNTSTTLAEARQSQVEYIYVIARGGPGSRVWHFRI